MRWIASMIAIAAGLLWLHRLGAGDFGVPPLTLDGTRSWLEHRDTAVAVFALLRLVAVGFGWYLLLITAIGGAAGALRLRPVTSAVDRLTFPFARGLLGGVALLGVMGTPPSIPSDASDSMIELSPEPTVVPDTTIPEDSATLHLLPGPSAPSAAPSVAAPSPEPSPSPTAPSADTTGSIDTWVVQHGESFWSIAAEHLGDVTGRPMDERDISSYWREVVEVNRSRLANPADADLLFAGQEIELPAVTAG
jgi:hypothetical protein